MVQAITVQDAKSCKKTGIGTSGIRLEGSRWSFDDCYRWAVTTNMRRIAPLLNTYKLKRATTHPKLPSRLGNAIHRGETQHMRTGDEDWHGAYDTLHVIL